MAVQDDLKRLAGEDILYLSHSWSLLPTPFGSATFWYRGRLRQASDASWVFQTFTGIEGVYGITLGDAGTNWSSSEIPASGLVITITNQFSQSLVVPGTPSTTLIVTMYEIITICQTPATSLQS